jgi:ketosteroid isomerase-like protein
VSGTAPKDVVRALVDAYNAKSVEGVLECYAEDAVFWDPFHRDGVRGRQAIGEIVRSLFSAFPDEVMSIVTLAGDGCRAVAEFCSTGTSPRDGEPFEVEFTEAYEVAAGRIVSCRVYLDPDDLPP